jgi:hypothetical protein
MKKSNKAILYVGIVLAMQFASDAFAVTYCNPERSKPCGGGCISLDKQCRTSWTTAKSGVNPNKAGKKAYSTPTFVDKAPTK